MEALTMISLVMHQSVNGYFLPSNLDDQSSNTIHLSPF